MPPDPPPPAPPAPPAPSAPPAPFIPLAPSGPPAPVTVTGGTHGISAHCDAMRAVAGRFGTAGADTLHSVLTLHGYLLDVGTALSAVLDPVGYAEFEACLLVALDGWQGLSAAALECGAIDAELRLAADAYETVDRLGTDVRDLILGSVRLAPALAAGCAALARTGDPIRAAQLVLARDPQLGDVVITALGIPQTLEVLGRAIPDGHGVVRQPGIDDSDLGRQPPHNLYDLIADLAERDGDTRHGMIDVRILHLPDGSRRAIVDITGTKSWDPLPTTDITSLSTNGRALVGQRTAYEGGVLAALHRAGVRRGEPVLLVGHSEGGMVAVNAARDAVASGEFTITHVITAGAPIGRTAGTLPAGVQLLALENSQDVIPHLDGIANPDRPNVTTATAKSGDATIGGDHAVDLAYLPVAADVDASHNASVRDFMNGAAGFFHAESVETHTYQIQRRY